MSVARFKVYGPKLDGAGGATIEIHRETGVVEVRPLRRRYTATVTLAWLAEAALFQRAKVLAAEKRTTRRTKRVGR